MKKILVLAIVAIFSLAMIVSGATAKNDNKSEKSINKELKSFEKSTSEKSNAKLYKENTKEAAKEVKSAAKEAKKTAESEGDMDQEEVAQEAEQIAVQQEQASEGTAEAIEQVESRNKFKKFLIGTDYKNLGELRSDLVHNRNQIRKITKLMEQNQDPALAESLQLQLTTMMQERERIKTVIQTNEEGFSLLGWVAKFISGYEETPLDEGEEAQLEEEVNDALENVTGSDTAPVVEATE